MLKFTTYKLPTIVGGLICCLGIAGCIQPQLQTELPPLPLNGPNPVLQPQSVLQLVGNEELPIVEPVKKIPVDVELPDADLLDGELFDDALRDDTLFDDDLLDSADPEPVVKENALQGVTNEVVERGRQAFTSTCTQCHDAEEALVVKKSYNGWIETINEMVEYAESEDAKINDADIVPIASYLSQRTDNEVATAKAIVAAREKAAENPVATEKAATDSDDKAKSNNDADVEYGEAAFNASCLQCHDANRSLSVKKSYTAWMSTIGRMAKKKDAQIDANDFAPIAKYLSNRSDEEVERAKRQSEQSKPGNDNDNDQEEEEEEEDVAPTAAEVAKGKEAFYRSCVKCHDAERSLSIEKSHSEWMATTRRMAAKDDAEIDSSDFRAIATFLSERSSVEIEESKARAEKDDEDSGEDDQADTGRKFDPAMVAAGRTAFFKSCVKCHDAERSLNKKKSLSSWRATVKRMAAKDGADVRPGDVEAISVFLAAESADGVNGPIDDDAGEVSPWTFSTTLSTLNRTSSDPIETPGFFVDAWVGADWQSDGPLRATVMACTSCHSDRNSSKGFTFELVEASATLDLKKLLFDKYHSSETKQTAARMTASQMTAGAHDTMLQLNGSENASASNTMQQSVESPISTSADLKMGRFIVPFGAYSSFSHPGSYRTVTNPLMFNMGRRLDTGGSFQPVLPAPYSDEGVNLRFALREYCDRSYTLDLFAVNGLQGTTSGANFNFSRSYTDNNRTPAVGGRYTLGNNLFRLGASGMMGRMQNDGSAELDYHLIGGDAVVTLERFRAYFEYAFRREQAGIAADNEIDGYVLELEWRLLERLGFLTRYDTLEHEIASAGEQSVDRFTWGINLTMQRAGLLLLNHEHWMLNDRSDVDVIGMRWITTF